MTARYGPVVALESVSLEVPVNSCVAVVGSNGAGKTTLARCIAGLTPLDSGCITLGGADVRAMSVEDRARSGLVLVPEGRGLLRHLTVEENLKLGAHLGYRKQEVIMDHVLSLFPALAKMLHRLAGRLSGGELQMLAVARALACEPRVLVLDEPSMGLAPLAIARVVEALEAVKGATSILLLEQNAAVGFAVAEFVYVLETGSCVSCGTPEELASRDDIRSAYLGIA